MTHARRFKSKSSSLYLVGIQDDFGLVNYVATQIDDNFEVYGVFVSVHRNVSLMFLAEKWRRCERW